jgi:DNA-binding transcriptional LysR family regulator
MNDWDLRKLRVLRALAETGTVTGAAGVLSMTPSAVSQALAALSRQTGAVLLEPEGRRVRLTEAARLLLRHAEVVFAELEQARAELDAYTQGDAGTVRVGAFATAVSALVVPAVRALRAGHPGLRVQVREAEADEAFELLARGEVEVALSLTVRAPAASDPAFTRFLVHADPMDLALAADHPLAGRAEVRLAEFAEDPWIFGTDGAWRDITLTACAAAGFTPEQGHAASAWPAILTMVAAGMGVSLVPRLARAGQEGVVLRELPADRPVRHVIGAVRTPTRRLQPVLRALRDVAASQGRGEPRDRPPAEG